MALILLRKVANLGYKLDEFVERYNEAVAYWQLRAGVSWSDIKKMERSDVENSIEEYDNISYSIISYDGIGFEMSYTD